MESGLILIGYYPEIKDTFLAAEINKVVSITIVRYRDRFVYLQIKMTGLKVYLFNFSKRILQL